MNREEVDDLVQKFLDAPRGWGGGGLEVASYAEAIPGDNGEFDALVVALIRFRFGEVVADALTATPRAVHPARWAQLQVVLGVLQRMQNLDPKPSPRAMAERILGELDVFVEVAAGGRGTFVPVVPSVEEVGAGRIIEALIKAPPAVLHSVFGILHNLKCAGPWKPATHLPVEATELPGWKYAWFRIDSKFGGPIARVGESGWWFKDTHHACHGLAQSMVEVDTAMTMEGWILVPGYTSEK